MLGPDLLRHAIPELFKELSLRSQLFLPLDRIDRKQLMNLRRQ
jgi:hypothetical protein